MDHSVRLDVVRPWRTATIVASAVAAIELVVIVVAGIALFGSAVADDVKQAATAQALAPAKPKPAPTSTRPMLPREETTVMVLNGNGRSGSAAAAAQEVRASGHPVASVGNAPRTDYGESVVMYRPGSDREARRLARAVGVDVVGPVDGVRLRDLMGAQLVIVVGN